MKSSHQKKIALSLSAFVLPGLGQLHLKQKTKGWAMILLCFFAIIFVLAKFMMGLLLVTEKTLHQKREILASIGKDLWQAASIQKEWLIGGFIFLVIVWAWSVWDVWKDSTLDEG